MTEPERLFPAFTEFAASVRLQEGAKGSLAAKLPRVLGQGTTRATGLDLPPAPIERQQELVGLVLPGGVTAPAEVLAEIESARLEVERRKSELSRADGQRVFAVGCVQAASAEHGFKDGQYYAEGLVLVSRKNGAEWAWSITPHYAIIDKIPPDSDYVVKAFHVAKSRIDALTVAATEFERRLRIAWVLAREFSTSDEEVLVTDVMKMYQVAGQDVEFWQSPRRAVYKDLPDAAFVVNLVNWRRSAKGGGGFEFVPALFSHTKGAHPSVFYLPMNGEGTEVRPMKYLRRVGR